VSVRPILSLLLATACGGDDLVLPSEGSPAKITIVSGDGQSGRVRELLPEPIVAQVTDTGDRPIEGVRVGFAFNGAGTVLAPETATTDADGQAAVRLWLGTDVGEGRGVAWVVRSDGPFLQASFTATAVPVDAGAPPTAANDAYSTLEGYEKTLLVAAPGVLANDDDHGNGPLRAGDASDPPNGKVSLRQDGSFSYSPDPDYWGEDSFTYRVTNRRGVSSRGSVAITVLPVNDSPRFRIRGGDQFAAADGGPQRVPGFAEVVSPGTLNEQGQVLDFIVQVDPQGAALFSQQPAITADGTLTYAPSGAPGRALVTVRLHDNGGTANGGDDTSAPQTFTITLSATTSGARAHTN
jgi:hypothetical protein